MLARELVTKKGAQPILIENVPHTNAYTIFNDRLYMLYHARLPWKDQVKPDDDYLTQPIVVGFRADEFMVGESNEDGETAFMAWAVGRAREIVDEKVFNQSWCIQLSPAHTNAYFHVKPLGDGEAKLHHKIFQVTSWHWRYFFDPDGHDHSEIEQRYREDVRY